MFRRTASRVGGAYLVGQGAQAFLGNGGTYRSGDHNTYSTGDLDTDETGDSGMDHASGGLASTYRDEQQSNEYMPDGHPFMGVGFWTAGNLLARCLPESGLRHSVETLSAPSNPNAYRNRQLVSTLPAVLGTMASIVSPHARVLAGAGQLASGFLLGTEHQAAAQSSSTPRMPPDPAVHTDPDQLASDYDQLSNQYAEAGYSSQSRITRVTPPNHTNAQVSHSIQRRLLPQYPSPFITNDEPKESDVL